MEGERMKYRTNAFGTRTIMVVLAILAVLVFVGQANAGITRDLVIHNYRDEVVSVQVVKTDGSSLEREVESQATNSIYIGDNEMGTTWIYYADSNGAELDRVPAWKAYADYHLEIR
jgi:hypothetical protein